MFIVLLQIGNEYDLILHNINFFYIVLAFHKLLIKIEYNNSEILQKIMLKSIYKLETIFIMKFRNHIKRIKNIYL